MSDRLVQLDGMRGLAALLVVGYHYTTRYQQIYGHPAPLPFGVSWGHYGVQLFFVISGFVIFMTLERTQDWRGFLVSRWARLFPAYWVAVLFTWLVVWRFSLPGREVPVSAMWINLSMLQEWLRTPHVDGVYWTLTIELAFYAIVLGLFALRLLRRLHLVVIVWLCAMLATHWMETRSAFRWPGIVKTSLLLAQANLFLAGMLFYQRYRREGGPMTTVLLAACLVVELVVHGTESALVCAAFFVLFWAVLRQTGWVMAALSTPAIVFVGTVSYSLYLLHQNIGYMLLRGLYAEGVAPGLAIPATVAMSLALAVVARRLIEVPGRDLIRAGWKKYQNRSRQRAT